MEQFTDRTNGGYERLLYVHEDLMGNTRYYTKTNGNSFAELTYDAWGMSVSRNKLLNNDHGNYVYATYIGHIFDTTLDIYFCEARFYDANTRQWMAMDLVKDGGNWYQYCYSNPLVVGFTFSAKPEATLPVEIHGVIVETDMVSVFVTQQEKPSQLALLLDAHIGTRVGELVSLRWDDLIEKDGKT